MNTRVTFRARCSPCGHPGGKALPSPENSAALLWGSLANAIKRNFAVNRTTGSSFLSFVTVGLSTPLVLANVPVSCCYCRAVFNIFLISPIPCALAKFSSERQPEELYDSASGKTWPLMHIPNPAHLVFSKAGPTRYMNCIWARITPCSKSPAQAASSYRAEAAILQLYIT